MPTIVKRSVETAPDEITINSVMRYPVKSLRGICGEARITDNGLEHDRIFMLASKMKLGDVAARLTLREHPELTQIATEYHKDGVLLTRPDRDSVLLPYSMTDGELVEAKLWHGPNKGSVGGLHVDTDVHESDVDAWLSDFVREEAQVLFVPDSAKSRRIMIENMQESQTTEFTGRATDGYPLHVASLASLRRLNESRKENGLPSIDIDHFRANIVIDGEYLEPFVEDAWAGIDVVSEEYNRTIRIMSVRACERCMTIEAAPHTGEKRRDVLKSLGNLKAGRVHPGKLVFGTWAAPSLASVGEVIREGAEVRPFLVGVSEKDHV